MIALHKKTLLNGLASLSSSWQFIGMHGTIPTTEPSQSFESLIAQGQCIFEATSEIRNDNHLKFSNVGNLVPYTGYFDTAEGIQFTTLDIQGTGLSGQAYLKFLNQDLATVLEIGQQLLIELPVATDLKQLTLDSPINIVALRLEVLVGENWELVGDVSNTRLQTLTVGKVASSVRLTNISGAPQSVYNCLEIFANQKPANAPAPQTVEWCLMVPKDPNHASSAYGDEFPYGWVDCSGPNDGATCILNTANPNPGDAVRLLYLTLQPAVVEF